MPGSLHHGWQEGLHRGLWELVSTRCPGTRILSSPVPRGTGIHQDTCAIDLVPTAPLCPRRGSAIAKIAGSNAARLSTFENQVNMWVLEEEVGGRRLTDIINTEHENVKYLPGHKLPPNLVSVAWPWPLLAPTAGLC